MYNEESSNLQWWIIFINAAAWRHKPLLTYFLKTARPNDSAMLGKPAAHCGTVNIFSVGPYKELPLTQWQNYNANDEVNVLDFIYIILHLKLTNIFSSHVRVNGLYIAQLFETGCFIYSIWLNPGIRNAKKGFAEKQISVITWECSSSRQPWLFDVSILYKIAL